MVWCGIACFLAGFTVGYFTFCAGYAALKKEEKEKKGDE